MLFRSAYVCNYGSSTISVIDVSTDTVSTTISGIDHPTSVIFTLDSSKAIVTNGINNTVTCILTASSTITATPGVGSAPSSIALTPDGTEAYVGNVGDSTISIVDVATDGVEPNVISVGPEPYGIAMTDVEPVPPPPPPPPPPTPINPPTKFVGEIIRSKNNCTRRAILSMTWNASTTAGVDLYQIFRHRKKIASIPATGPLMFRTCLHSKHLMSRRLSREWIEHVENNYRIRAVANGIPSPLVRLKVTSIVNVDVLPHSGSSSSSGSDSLG